MAPPARSGLTLGYAVPALARTPNATRARRRVLAAGQKALNAAAPRRRLGIGTAGDLPPATCCRHVGRAALAMSGLHAVVAGARAGTRRQAGSGVGIGARFDTLRRGRLQPPGASWLQSPAPPQTLVEPGSTVRSRSRSACPTCAVPHATARALASRHGFRCLRVVGAASLRPSAARTRLRAGAGSAHAVDGNAADRSHRVARHPGAQGDWPGSARCAGACERAPVSRPQRCQRRRRHVVAQRPPANGEYNPARPCATTQRVTEVRRWLAARSRRGASADRRARTARSPDSPMNPRCRRARRRSSHKPARALLSAPRLGVEDAAVETIVPEVTGRSLDEARCRSRSRLTHA